MSHALYMISFIGKRYEFCMGAAGYPEGHIKPNLPAAINLVLN
jgi:5,10-methylenetetrahydrofolate reductase